MTEQMLAKTSGKVLPAAGTGRPSDVTEEVTAKLDEVFKLGVTVETACRYAQISIDSFYRACKRDEAFARKMDTAREFARLAAGQVVMDAIVHDKDLPTARWYLEKKHGAEFSGPPRLELNQNNQIINVEANHEQLSERLAQLFGVTATASAVEDGEEAE
jgi:hypothetical protein